MKVVTARNVHRALPMWVSLLQQEGVVRQSRVGPCVELPEPAVTVYTHPLERVLLWSGRDANPFFHLFEALYLLAGRRDVAWLSQFNSKVAEYSDGALDEKGNEVFHASYGYRWRYHFDMDQLLVVVQMLRQDPANRRAVIQMWDVDADLGTKSNDLPCNTMLFPKIRDGLLLLTVVCRSNDLVWGLTGANAVQFSILQEYLAEKIGVDVGPMSTLSDSLHAYEGVWEKVHNLPLDQPCPYENGEVAPTLLRAWSSEWDADLIHFLDAPLEARHGESSFFRNVARPFYRSHLAYKSGDHAGAFAQLATMDSSDWSRAAIEWLRRRRSMQGAAR